MAIDNSARGCLFKKLPERHTAWLRRKEKDNYKVIATLEQSSKLVLYSLPGEFSYRPFI